MTKKNWRPGEYQFNLRLGLDIRKRRTARKITQEELAKALGISRPQMSNMEAGRSPITAWEVLEAHKFFEAKDLHKAQKSRIIGSSA